MIVARRRFSRPDRAVAGLLGIVCVAGGIATFAVGLARGHPFLATLGIPVFILGVVYEIAAWKGRPLGPR